jgi:hypothetical protein
LIISLLKGQSLVLNQSSTIQQQVLVTQIDKHIASGRSMNMRLCLNYYTIDLFSKLLYGHTFDYLERENYLVDAETLEGKLDKVRFIKLLHDATVINTILGMEAPLLPLAKKVFSWHPYKKPGAN